MGLDETAWQAARDRIGRAARAAGRDPATVRLVAVSKTQPAGRVRDAHALGQRAFGENYVQEAAAKLAELGALAGIEWRMIGPLQSNKAAEAARVFDGVESVDRLKIAERLSAARASSPRPLEVMVQVNVSGEPQQGGCAPERVAAVVEGSRDLGLDVRGLMAIGPRGSEGRVRAAFASVRDLADRLGLVERSMGMSGDLELAVAEGSTMVRVGTDLVGPRRPGPHARPGTVGT